MEKSKRKQAVGISPKFIRLPLDKERKIMLNVIFYSPENFRVFLDDATELEVDFS